jgi:hypothetical protein
VLVCCAGRGGEECAKADGRELWVLGEMYEVAGLHKWLLSVSIRRSNLAAAYEFGLAAEGDERNEILAKCVEKEVNAKEWKDVVKSDAEFVGVGREAVKKLALARAKQGKGQRLGWRYVRDAFNLLDGWVRANAGESGAVAGDAVSWFRASVAELDIGAIPLNVLREVVVGSENLDGGWASGVIERKEAAGDNAYEVEYREGRTYSVSDYDNEDTIMNPIIRMMNFGLPREQRYTVVDEPGITGSIAIDVEGQEQRMAVIYEDMCQVKILQVDSGECLATAGSPGEGPGEFVSPAGLVFSGAGELYVSDMELHRISVFDREGRYLRGFGERGEGMKQLHGPSGLCFTAEGKNLVVADFGNDRVQVFQEDGTIVRTFGTKGENDGQFRGPWDVCCMPDGSIAVLDQGNYRVVLLGIARLATLPSFAFEHFRSFGSKGDGPGQFLHPDAIVAGGRGEVIVADSERKDIQVFSAEGELLQIIGSTDSPIRGLPIREDDRHLDSCVHWHGLGPVGVAACADGRLLVTAGSTKIAMLCGKTNQEEDLSELSED